MEFEATQEAFALVRADRIEVSDNTRPQVFDGDVVDQKGLMLELSQPFIADPAKTYVIQLQLFDKQVQIIPITVVASQWHVLLQNPPLRQLITRKGAPNKFSQTTYQIVANENIRTSAFIVEEIEPQDNMTVEVRAFNYDERYYRNDDDINQGIFQSAEQVKIAFRENFEGVDVDTGQFVLVNASDNMQAFGGPTFEVQNNVPGIGMAGEGAKHAELSGVDQGIVGTVVTDTEKTYELLLWYSGRPNVNGAINRIDVYWNGTFFITLEDDLTGQNEVNWKPFFLALPKPTAGLTELRLVSVNDDGSGRGGLVDDIRIREHSGNAQTSFQPINVPGLWTWLKNDEADFDLDTAGGDVDEIDRWHDQSGLADPHDAFQNTNSQRPFFNRSQFDGNYVEFRNNTGQFGTNAEEWFQFDNVDDAQSGAKSIFVVMALDRGDDNQVSALLSSDDNSTPDSHIYFAPNGNSADGNGDFGISLDGNAVPDVGTWYVNGVPKGFGTNVGMPGDIEPTEFQVHSIIMNNASNAWEILGALEEGGLQPNVGFRGRIKELIIYSETLGDETRKQIENYLIAKHGINMNNNVFVGDGTDQTAAFQTWINVTIRNGTYKYGKIIGDVNVTNTIRFEPAGGGDLSVSDFTLVWESGQLLSTATTDLLYFDRCNRYNLLGNWRLKATGGQAARGMVFDNTGNPVFQRGNGKFGRFVIENCVTAMTCLHDTLEQINHEHLESIDCAQLLFMNSPSMDAYVLNSFNGKAYSGAAQNLPVVDIVQSGNITLGVDRGLVSHIVGSSHSIKLGGGTHSLYNVSIENPNVRMFEIGNGIGRNDTILVNCFGSPASHDATDISLYTTRTIKMFGCAMAKDATFDGASGAIVAPGDIRFTQGGSLRAF